MRYVTSAVVTNQLPRSRESLEHLKSNNVCCLIASHLFDHEGDDGVLVAHSCEEKYVVAIVDGRGGRMTHAAAGLAQMGVGLAVLTETKLVDNKHPKTASGYTIMCSKAVSGHQGGVALMWKEDNPKFEVESVLFNNGPNIVTFQVTTGVERFYVIGVYIPPDCNKGVDDLRRAWEACPHGCKLIILGDLNINFGFPRDKREEIIVDLLDEINLIDTSRRFRLRTTQRASTRARWTWSHQRQGRWYYSQPDYCMAREGDMANIRGVGFRSPRFLHSDHRAVVVNIQVGWAGTGRLKQYRRECQQFPLTLPLGPKDANTTTFDALAAKCVEPKTKRPPGKDWISEGAWSLIAKRASLLRSGKIRQDAARRMKREVKAALKADMARLTAEVGANIGAQQWKRAGGVPPPERVVPECLGNPGQALPSNDGVSDG
jgi:hypothetical protein